MRISRRHGFCFIHIPKTGGTSIAHALDDNLKRSDLIKDSLSLTKMQRGLKKIRGDVACGKHETTYDMIRKKPETNNMLKFAVVRNPYDWLESFYRFITLTGVSPDTGKSFRHNLRDVVGSKSFNEFVRWVVLEDGLNNLPVRRKSSFSNKSPVLQSDWVCDHDGRLLVDHVLKFESLESDFKRVCKALGLNGVHLPRENVGIRKDDFILDERERKMVRDYFFQDFARFGY